MDIAVIAAAEYGLVSRCQLLELGHERHAIWRRAVIGGWVEVLPGVFRLPGTPESWRQQLMAACLWGGPDARASHRSAAALFGLEGFREGPVEIAASKQNRTGDAGLAVYRRRPDRRFVTSVDGIPVTNVARTLIDLAGVAGRRGLVRARDDACRRHLTSRLGLSWAVEQVIGPGVRGAGALRALLDEEGPSYSPSASEAQKDLRTLLAGLPFVEEFEIRHNGKVVARVDLGSPEHPVVVELDGKKYHAGEDDFVRDLRRRNRITRLGSVVLHFTPDDLDQRPQEISAQVREALARYGALSPGGARSRTG